jgi:adhesin transport system outer membrane protein
MTTFITSSKQKHSAMIRLLTLILAGMPFCVIGQTMSEAVLMSLDQYPAILAAQSKVNSAEADIGRARGAHWPQVVWQGTQNAYNSGAVANNWIQSPSVSLNVWSGWKIESDVARSKAILDSSKQQQRITRDDVALLATEGYLSWARGIELLRLAHTNAQAHQKIFKDIQIIVRADEGRRIDLDQAQVRLENSTLIIAQRESELVMSTERLNRMLLGRMPKLPSGIDRQFPMLPASAQASLSEINDLHPLVANQIAQVNANKANLLSAKSQHSPTVNVTYGKQTYQGTGQGDYLAQLVVQVPIFSGGTAHGAVGAASGQLEAARYALQETRLVLREKILSGWAELISAKRRSELGKKQITTSQSLLRGYTQQFQIGRRSLIDLLNVQSDLYNYQSAAITADFDIKIAQARILASMGKLAISYTHTHQHAQKQKTSLDTSNPQSNAFTSR